MIVAEITKDHLGLDDLDLNREGKQFDYESMCKWGGWPNPPATPDERSKTEFQLFDDDDELYYEGWLLNDPECLVQQFVLAWAEKDSGCTKILVKKEAFVQEIS